MGWDGIGYRQINWNSLSFNMLKKFGENIILQTRTTPNTDTFRVVGNKDFADSMGDAIN